jgi:hypothetical protein
MLKRWGQEEGRSLKSKKNNLSALLDSIPCISPEKHKKCQALKFLPLNSVF